MCACLNAILDGGPFHSCYSIAAAHPQGLTTDSVSRGDPIIRMRVSTLC